jgi:hypothetical protein
MQRLIYFGLRWLSVIVTLNEAQILRYQNSQQLLILQKIVHVIKYCRHWDSQFTF